MKNLLLVAAGAMGAIMLSGCASHETTTTTSTANPARRTYSNSQLNKTGQPDTAGAIEAVDPDAQITR
jgi:outer membrane murein-binding lipoprotein Lpp